jgi:hypothetical protein
MVLKELLRSQAPGTVIEELGLVQDVLEELTPRERHARCSKTTGHGGRSSWRAEGERALDDRHRVGVDPS